MNKLTNRWAKLDAKMQGSYDDHSAAGAAGAADSVLAKLNVIRADHLISKDIAPVDFLIDDLLPACGLAMLGGGPKVGKSWECMRIIKQLCGEGKEVFYLSAEDNEARLQKRLKQSHLTNLRNLQTIAGMSQDNAIPRGKEGLRMLQEIADVHAPHLIIVDTVANILNPDAPKKGRSEYQVTELEYAELRRVAHQNDIAILLVHHTRKVTDAAVSPFENLLGSQAIAGTVETIMVMTKEIGKKDCKLHVTGKDVEQNEFYLKWNGDGFDFSHDPELATLGPRQSEMLDVIKRKPRITQKGIIEELDVSQAYVSKTLTKLIDKELVVELGRGGYAAMNEND